MKSFNRSLKALLLLLAAAVSGNAFAGTPPTENGVTKIVLDEYNGYFAARDTLVNLKPGTYEFTVTNKSNKLVGFLLQDGDGRKNLDQFPIEPGQTRTSTVTITDSGFRYRCPINPTPWYDVSVQ